MSLGRRVAGAPEQDGDRSVYQRSVCSHRGATGGEPSFLHSAGSCLHTLARTQVSVLLQVVRKRLNRPLTLAEKVRVP